MNIAPAAAGPPGRILLVEDDPEAAFFATHVLATLGGFDVVHTCDPATALARARSEPWNLVLTDLDLPGLTGLELLQALRCSHPDLPVAVITAHASTDPLIKNLRESADAFLAKPVSPAQLTAVATTLITRGRTAGPAREAPPG